MAVLTIRGHGFLYETENVARLFLDPLKVSEDLPEEGDTVLAEAAPEASGTRIRVSARIGGKTAEEEKRVDAAPEDKETERQIAETLFRVLSGLTGKRPPWGIVTGIRPSKYVLGLYAQGWSKDEIRERFMDRNLVLPEKADLAIEVADHSLKAASLSDRRSFSLYVSIPFCPTRCSYCSFVSKTVGRDRGMLEEYLQKLILELRDVKRRTDLLGLRPETVYIGGGTPTTLSAQQLALLTSELNDLFGARNTREFSVEAGRPDTITEEKLRVLKEAGVSRISINPQTGSDEVLRLIGRNHTAAEIEEAFRIARAIGFDNINADLIAGLTGDTPEGFRRTLEWIGGIDPENVTVHALTLKRASRMRDDGEKGVSGAEQMVRDAGMFLKQKGYLPYYMYKQKSTLEGLENTGYAKPGFDCLYNIFIMEEMHTIIACGAGGVSKLVDQDSGLINRIFNYKYPAEYISGFETVLARKDDIERFYGSWDHWNRTE